MENCGAVSSQVSGLLGSQVSGQEMEPVFFENNTMELYDWAEHELVGHAYEVSWPQR